MKRKVIGICGFIGCGKGTVGDILVEQYGFTKISFADRLKDTASTLFDWPRDMIEGNTPESRVARNT
jgi:adenylate kinase family enzyme